MKIMSEQSGVNVPCDIKGTVEAIGRMAVGAHGVKIIELKKEPEHVYGLQKPDGSYERIEAIPEPRHYTVETLVDLRKAAMRQVTSVIVPNFDPSDRDVQETVDIKAAVQGMCCFVGNGKVVLLLNEVGDRFERVDLILAYTPEFAVVNGWLSRMWWTQKEAVDVLRTVEFRVEPDMRSLLRSARFSSSREEAGTTGPAGNDVSLSIKQRAVFGTEDPPEDVFVYLPVLELLRDNEPEACIRCLFNVDYEKGKVQIVPACGEMARVIRLAEAVVRQKLEAELLEHELGGVDILCGVLN